MEDAMNESINLKQIERKAWTSYFQDGLTDMNFGILMLAIAIQDTCLGWIENSWLRTVVFMVIALLGGLLTVLARRFMTMPRLGLVKYNTERKRKGWHLSIILGVLVLLTVLMVLVTALANRNPETWGRIMPGGLGMPVFVAIFVGGIFTLIAWFIDFWRGYLIAFLFAVSIFVSMVLHAYWMFWITGTLVTVTGVVLFILFLRKHPIPHMEETHGRTGKG
jgi:hypothetical protein